MLQSRCPVSAFDSQLSVIRSSPLIEVLNTACVTCVKMLRLKAES